jgi:hypothetical protein
MSAPTPPIRTSLSFFHFCRYALLIGSICCFTKALQAQGKHIHGIVVNQSSKEKIAFASVSWKRSKKGGLTDSTGAFNLPISYAHDTLIVSYVGFNTRFIPVNLHDTAELNIELEHKLSEEVVVASRYNKGLFWWKKVVQHKKVNNPWKFNTYSFQLYKKLEVDLNNVSREKLAKVKLLKPFDFILDDIDTLGSQPYLPVYITESLSKFFSATNPYKRREDILAVQTNGIKSEVVLHFIDGLNQQVNVYENSVTLFGKEFVSPFSNSGDAWYNFRAADTQYINNKRYLHLFFSPKRQGENTFSGDCWIYSNTWAIQKINLEISPTANINYVNQLTISQEFVQQNDSTWVFAKDKLIADISLIKKNKRSMIIRQTSIYNDVHVNEKGIATILENNTETDQVSEHDSARMRTAAYWQSKRPEPLSTGEQKVYRMIDTLNTIPLFKKYTKSLEFIVDGRMKLGRIEIGPWYKWVSSNQHEKWRVRFDIGTTEQFSKSLYLHSYIAYGFGDHKLKGNLNGNYKFPGNGGYAIQASYLHDLDNGLSLTNDDDVKLDNMFSQMIRRPGINQKFIQVDEIKVSASKEWNNKLTARAFFSRAGYETFTPLPPKKLISVNAKDINNTELGVAFRYAPGEKKIVTHRKSIRLKSNNPVFEARYMIGVKGLLGGQYQYHKVNVSVNQHLSFPGWGRVDYKVYGGKIWGDALPFMLLEQHAGNETYYYSKQSFNLINRFEYFSDQYAGFTVEHNFEKKLLNLLPFLRKVDVRQFWNVKAVWGDLSPANKKLNCTDYRNYRMTSLQGKPYIELGTGLDNIFRYFRADLVWRLNSVDSLAGTQQHPPVSHFGIFGSFHIQF